MKVPLCRHCPDRGPGNSSQPTARLDAAISEQKGPPPIFFYSNSASKLRLKGQGAPIGGSKRGDEYVRLSIVLPKKPDLALEAFVDEWEAGKGHNPREDKP